MVRAARFVVAAVVATLVGAVAEAPPVGAEGLDTVVAEASIASGADDVEQTANGYMMPASTDLELVDADEGAGQTVGLRFTGVGLPQGATITEAWVQFTVDEAQSVATALTITGDASDDAAPFTTAQRDVTSRPRTVAGVAWQPEPWSGVGTAPAAARTPDLSGIVQELVDRSGWTPASALALVIGGAGHRTAIAYDQTPALAPRLHVAYTPPPAPDPTVVTVDRRVARGTDDAEEITSSVSTGAVTRSSGDLEMVEDGTVTYAVGLRFDGLAIPPGAEIVRSWIQFTAREAQSDPTSLTITAQDLDNAPVLGPNNFNVTSRPRTTTSVAWSPPPWLAAGQAGRPQRTPDLSAAIQEVVDRPYWWNGSALGFTIGGTGHRTAVAYDLNPTQAPALHVEYRLGTPEPYTPASVRLAAIADFGNGGAGAGRVANLVAGLDVDAVVTGGDNSYTSTPIDENIGRFYQSYIGNYRGAYGTGSPLNRFFPSIGNHDYTDGAGLPGYLDYFDLPGNERYYEVALGPVQVFVVNSNPEEPDGIAANSAQAAWLRNGLASSTSPWQLVVMHHSPFSSGEHGSDPVMQWPYAAWGADAVLSGHDHNYERLESDGIPYLISGNGGVSRYAAGTMLPNSRLFYGADDGALIIDACPGRLTFAEHTISNGVVDRLTVGGPDCSPPEVTVEATDDVSSETGEDTGAVSFRRTGARDRALSVRYTTSGSATPGDDYAPLSGVATIPAGSDQVTITVTAVDDEAVEDDEDIVVTLVERGDYRVPGTGVATVGVRSDDRLPTVTASATDGTGAEPGSDTGTITLTRTGPTAQALDLTYTVDGSATAGSDYESLPGTATIPAGSASTTVTVTPLDDPGYEADESVRLTVTDGDAYDLGTPSVATVTVRSEDPATVTRDLYGVEQTRVFGTITAGGLLSLRTSDNQRLNLREELGTSNPPNSLGEYRVRLAPLPTFQQLTLVVEAHRTANTEGDDLLVDWSRNGGPWHNLLTVTKVADNGTAQFKVLPSWISAGDVVSLRIRDANRTPGRRVLDTLSVDRLFLRAVVPN